MSITDYEPKLVWKHFDELRKIPRCTGNEEQARRYVLGLAERQRWEAQTDRAGNVVIRVPATPGRENAPVVAIQGHLDIVCEKNADVRHDFSKDAIDLHIDGEWLKANGTTLGSDNGVGVAAALAAAESRDVVHGPLELLFTVEEETGLIGAGKLQPGFISAKYLLNLDSEELGSVFIGCSGGGESTITLPVTRTGVPPGASAMRVRVSGLRGGHSGLDIIEQRGNAIKILSRLLWQASPTVQVSSIQGGNKRNAVPREAQAEIAVAPAEASKLRSWLEAQGRVIAGELGGREPSLKIVLEPFDGHSTKVLDMPSRKRLLDLLIAIPHGVEAMSYDIPGLVETSTNLALVTTSENELVIGTQSRSSIGSALQALRDRIRACAESAGATVVENTAYPGWKANLESELLKVTRGVHKNLFGQEPEAKAVHAGLECGIIGEKHAGLDMISFGPRIEHPHSPDERINIPSVAKFWKLLVGVLDALA
jgi:dipeptidase D